jgi:hypothetical protein
MNDTTSDLEQTDEEILTYRVSDEALEASAGTTKGPLPTAYSTIATNLFLCC